MRKKGISPLIATVLILGFTVALAAVIMTWGTGFTRRMQEQTEETANIQVICATDVAFEVKSACELSAGHYKITIANNGNKDIDSFQLRFYKSEGDVNTASESFNGGIGAFGIKTADDVDSKYTGAQEVKQIEAIPVITVGGKSITCAQNIDSFGDVAGTAIATCT